MTSCANHPEEAAAARCVRCGTPCCDPCIGFLVNDDPWCEPCGNGEIESGKGNPALAILVFVALLGVWGGLMCLQLFVARRVYIATTALVLVPFGAAWRIAYPPTAGERPRIVTRSGTPRRPSISLAKRLA
jgi:hypothetical protein